MRMAVIATGGKRMAGERQNGTRGDTMVLAVAEQQQGSDNGDGVGEPTRVCGETEK